MSENRRTETGVPRITETEIELELRRLVNAFGWPGTPRNTDCISEDYIKVWVDVFGGYTYTQVHEAVTEFINSEESLKRSFPIPGRVKKYIRYDPQEQKILETRLKAAFDAERKKEKQEWLETHNVSENIPNFTSGKEFMAYLEESKKKRMRDDEIKRIKDAKQLYFSSVYELKDLKEQLNIPGITETRLREITERIALLEIALGGNKWTNNTNR